VEFWQPRVIHTEEDELTTGRNLGRGLAVSLVAFLFFLSNLTGASAGTLDGSQSFNAPWINYMWSSVYPSTYRAPDAIHWFSNDYQYHWPTLCNSTTAKAGSGGFYCSLDETIFLDWDWGQEVTSTFGDYAYGGYIQAHEWGHHISFITGWFTWASQNGLYRQRELQADCFAGLYTRYMHNQGYVNDAGVQQAANLAWAIGDGLAGYVQTGTYDPNFQLPYNDQHAHGAGTVRAAWFSWGYQQYSVAACNRVFGA
jgi:predicted metalloprotease